MSKFTVTVKGAGLIDAATEKNLIKSANYVANLLDRYIAWQGVLDIEIQVKPASALTWSTANGLMPALGQITWNGSNWINSTLNECLTGVDTNTQLPDAGCTIYLGSDGTIRNYGTPVWFDPNPQFDVKPELPSGYFDFIGVLTHEIFHCLGFYGATDQWKKYVIQDGAQSYFNGPITRALLGGPLPLSPSDNSDHYGNTSLAGNNVPRGLMFQWGNYELNRLDIGRIDLAVLQDLGYQIKTYEGLPLFELADSSPNITGAASSDNLYGNYQNNIILGLGGNDIIDGGAGTDTASWTHPAKNYILNLANGAMSVKDKTGVDGTDTLISIERLNFTDRTVILDAQAHASYAGLPTELYQFFITAFNAAPGVTYMDQLADAYRYGLSVKQIVDIFTTKSQFTNVYPTTLSNLDMATQLVNNIVKTSATIAVKASAVADIKAAMDGGWTVGQVIYQVFGNLAKMPLTDPSWGNTTKQFNNEIAVAKYYTEILNQSTTDLETLKDVIQSVTQSTDVSTDAVIAQLIGVELITGGLTA